MIHIVFQYNSMAILCPQSLVILNLMLPLETTIDWIILYASFHTGIIRLKRQTPNLGVAGSVDIFSSDLYDKVH